MEIDEDWKNYLRPTLQMLALASDAQARANGPGCPTCDMSEDFYSGREFALQTGNLSVQQVALLNRINDLLQARQPSDDDCFNPKALNEPVWANVRSVANRALLEFGWDADDLPPFVEIQPGVWQQKEKKAKEPNWWLRQLFAIAVRVRSLFGENAQ